MGLLALLLPGMSACGPKRAVIPDEVEPIARNCYEALVTPGNTPQLKSSQSMGDGTFLILWSIAESPDQRGSCTVDGRGAVLLLTSNADGQQQAEEKTEGKTEDKNEGTPTPEGEPATQEAAP